MHREVLGRRVSTRALILDQNGELVLRELTELVRLQERKKKGGSVFERKSKGRGENTNVH